VILGELVPKRLALLFPDVIARRMAPFLAVVATILRPFVTLLTVSTAAILKLMGVRDERTNDMTAEEVETVLAEGADAGLIEPEERAMINEVLRLGDRPVRVAMTPRRDLFWISLADSQEEILAEIRACPYSRIVVASEDDLDGDIGVILKKDLLDACLGGEKIDIRATSSSRSPSPRPCRCCGPWRCSSRRRCTWPWWSTSSARSRGRSPRWTCWR
jgi:putative hemolysin